MEFPFKLTLLFYSCTTILGYRTSVLHVVVTRLIILFLRSWNKHYTAMKFIIDFFHLVLRRAMGRKKTENGVQKIQTHYAAHKLAFNESCVYKLVSWNRILEYKAAFSTEKTKVLAKGWTSHDLMRLSEGMSWLTSLLWVYWCTI